MKKDLNTLKTCKDGTQTLYSSRFDETYHSINGSVQESKHVFIEAGLQPFLNKKELTVFEMGFGTGLNALLTFEEALRSKCKIKYISIDAFPLNAEELNLLSFEQLKIDEQYCAKIFSAKWNQSTSIHPYFELKKIETRLQDVVLQENVDIVYYDAFSPRVQPKLWTEEIFEKLYSYLNKDGVLVTYCAKGYVKRNLKAAGFLLESLPGPAGKREMTRARKS